ncbi:Basic helix-loop-helix protein A [Glycine max]|nr:Basic helix-loop-helix protein A [Glycine max]
MRSMERVVVRVKAVEVEAATSVQVSIIESSMLLEIEWPHREGFLIDVMHMSSFNNGVLVAELRAKVKEHVNGKVSIVEVKRAFNQNIPHAVD